MQHHVFATSHILAVFSLLLMFFVALPVSAQVVATTTMQVSICGDSLVNAGEECDIVGETGQYSTTILGRQCDVDCMYGPYCGDGILQTIYGEECDDANNVDNDFCSALCKVENAGGGGGGGGGGGSGGGGRDEPLGDTQVTIQGRAFPNATVHILIDGEQVGTVRTNGRGEFLFNTATDPGTASFGFWANDGAGTRSTTVNTTFDVTQGAVTNLSGILVPPTIRSSSQNSNPGDAVTLSGQTIPNATVQVRIEPGARNLTATADSFGNWSLPLATASLSADEYTAKARFSLQEGALKTESPYGTALSLFIGVAGRTTSNADLNRDGKVNLIDFSIMVFWWGTAGGNSNPPADINQNAKVGLEDFSILLFNWTG